MKLVKAIYHLSKKWPADELHGLTGQLRRTAVAIPSNIAEGHGRRSGQDFPRFLGSAYGSLMQVETQLQLAHHLGYLPESDLKKLLEASNELGGIIYGLRKKAASSS